MDYDEFLIRLEEIRQMGKVESRRKGNTGIGKTQMLGITETNIAVYMS